MQRRSSAMLHHAAFISHETGEAMDQPDVLSEEAVEEAPAIAAVVNESAHPVGEDLLTPAVAGDPVLVDAAPPPARARRPRQPPKPKGPPVAVTVMLDEQDLAWLAKQAYPLGVSPEDFLRMFVRQSRLGVNGGAMPVRGPQHQVGYHQVARPAATRRPAAATMPRPGSAAYAELHHQDAAIDDDLTASLVADALAAAPDASPFEQLAYPPPVATNNVVSLPPRSQQPGPPGMLHGGGGHAPAPAMGLHAAFGG